ncbi:MAG: ethanolamine permease [Desulfobacterales bacterium]|nr:ethanolamine permease [Desulfobacterales bacterium]
MAGQKDDYFEQRELKKGAAGWVLLSFLGVAYVISGDFAGWNFGIAKAGWGGLLIATFLMAIMYTSMVLSEAELSTIVPSAGGGYGFARRAFGPLGGYMTGVGILFEYCIAPAAIAVFISGYCGSLFGPTGSLIGYVPEGLQSITMVLLGGTWATKLLFYVVFVGVHLYGVGEALTLCMIITVIAVIALVAFIAAMIPHFNMANLFDIPANPAVSGSTTFLPHGWMGVWAALPFGMWFFLGVEGIPLAAEECENPTKDMPRAIIAAMTTLLIFAALILFFGPAGSSAMLIQDAADPLIGAIQSPNAYGGPTFVSRLINVVGLAGLVASFFSLIFGASRQFFALSRAGYLPTFLSLTGKRKTPYVALWAIGILGFVLSLVVDGDSLLVVAVFGASISYILMTASHFVLRMKEPDLHRPYKTPGGMITSGVSVILGCFAFVACFLANAEVTCYAAALYAAFLLYFHLHSRHHLISKAPEEEFAAIAAAEEKLN